MQWCSCRLPAIEQPIIFTQSAFGQHRQPKNTRPDKVKGHRSPRGQSHTQKLLSSLLSSLPVVLTSSYSSRCLLLLVLLSSTPSLRLYFSSSPPRLLTLSTFLPLSPSFLPPSLTPHLGLPSPFGPHLRPSSVSHQGQGNILRWRLRRGHAH